MRYFEFISEFIFLVSRRGLFEGHRKIFCRRGLLRKIFLVGEEYGEGGRWIFLVAEDFFEKRYKFPAKKGFHVPFWGWHHFHHIKIGSSQSLGWFISSKPTDSDRILTNYLCNYGPFCHLPGCQPIARHIFVSGFSIRSDKGYKWPLFFGIFVPFSKKLLFLIRQAALSGHENKPKLVLSAAVPNPPQNCAVFSKQLPFYKAMQKGTEESITAFMYLFLQKSFSIRFQSF